MKKKILFVFFTIFTVSILFLLTRFNLFFITDRSGYVLSSNDIYNNLLNSSNEDQVEDVKALKVQNYENFYSYYNKVYVGDLNKTIVDSSYPIITDDNSYAINLSNKNSLIDSEFDESESYLGMTLVNGEAYNQADNTKIDNSTYYFFKLENDLFINSFEINYVNNDYKKDIPVNSIIKFTDTSINFYNLDDGYYKYNSINIVNDDSFVSINDKEYKYFDFIENLGIIEIIEEEESIVVPDDPEIKDEEVKDENKYVKPEVNLTDIKINTYSFGAKLNVVDPSERIVTLPTFVFYLEDQIYLKKEISDIGDFLIKGLEPGKTFKIVGSYTFLNENNDEIRKNFYDESITMGSVEDLDEFTIEVLTDALYSNKVEFSSIKIVSDLSNEAINGIYKAEIEIAGNKYSITKSKINSLIVGNSITASTAENLESNTEYDFVIKFYDKFNNELPVKNNSGSVKTLKRMPTVDLEVDADEFSAKLDVIIDNPDDIKINNFYYEVYDNENNLIAKDYFDIKKSIQLNDLKANKSVYFVNIYADYDLEDGNGLHKKQLMLNTSFYTTNLELGSLRLNFEKTEIGSNNAVLTTNITNIDGESDLLIEMLSKVRIYLTDDDNNVAQEVILEGEDLELLKQYINEGGMPIEFTELKSKRTYYINIEAYVSQGSFDYEVNTTKNLNSFITKTSLAEFIYKNIFHSTNKISFNAKIIDEMKTIIDEKATIYVLKNGNVIAQCEIMTNKTFEYFEFEDLDSNTTYTFRVVVGEVVTDVYYEDSLLEEFTIKTDSLTEVTVGGKINLDSLLSKIESKNKIDISNNDKWLSSGSGVDMKSVEANKDSTKVTLGIKANGSRYYNYYLPELAKKKVYVTFKFKYIKNDYITDNNKYASFYLTNTKSSASNPIKLYFNSFTQSTSIVSYDFYYNHMSYGTDYVNVISDVFTLNANGYLDFMLKSSDISYTTNIELVDLSVNVIDNLNLTKIQDVCTDFDNCYNQSDIYFEDEDLYKANFDIRYYQKYAKIITMLGSSDYDIYLKYSNDTINNCKSSTCNKYFMEMDKVYQTNYFKYNTNKKDAIYYYKLNKKNDDQDEVFNIYLELFKNSDYSFQLVIVTDDSEYILDRLSFSTENEIRSINNKTDWQYVHDKGKYLVNNNIDFSSGKTVLMNTTAYPFYGEIDFNGNTITNHHSNSYLVYNLGSTGILKNIVFKLDMNTTGNYLRTMYPFVYSNSGTISNIYYKVQNDKDATFEYSTHRLNNAGLLTTANYGTIENFAFYLNAKIRGAYGFGLITNNNYGVIRNGYITGTGSLDLTGSSDAEYYLTSKRVGGVVGQTSTYSNVSNVYTSYELNGVDSDKATWYEASYGSVIGYAVYGNLSNVIAINKNSDTKFGANQGSLPTDPAIGMYNSTYFHWDNLYQLTNNTNINSTMSNKLSLSYLMNIDFLESVLNKDYNKFIIKPYINSGFYPILDWPDNMPTPQLMELDTEQNNVFKVLKAEDVAVSGKEETYTYGTGENKYNTRIVKLTLYNPGQLSIDNVNISGVSVENVNAKYNNNNKSIVYLKLTNPTEYISEYQLTKIKFTNGTEKDLSSEPYIINTSFYKEISSVSDWKSMVTNINQKNDHKYKYWNYALTSDIDFSGITYDKTYTIYNINSTYSGKFYGIFDGNNYKIKNLSTKYNFVFAYDLYGTFKNVIFEDLHFYSANSNYVGIISRAYYNAVIDNVHIKNISQDSKGNKINTFNIPLNSGSTNVSYIGGIVGYSNYSTISNCTVSNINVFKNEVDGTIYNEFTNSPIIGGIAGYITNSTLKNCYSFNFDYDQFNNYTAGTVGGIVGNSSGGVLENNVSNGVISTSSRNAGGIVGVSSSFVRNNITKMNMTSSNNYLGGIVGNVSGTNLPNIYSNLSLGDVYSSSNIGFVGRIVGFYKTTSARSNNYAYQGQSLNGFVTNESDSETLLSNDELSIKSIYTGLIGLDDNYNYDEISKVVNGVYSLYVPRLNYSYDKTKLLNEEIDIGYASDTRNLVIENVDVVSDNNLLENDVEYLTITIHYAESSKDKYVCKDIHSIHFENDSLVYENGTCSNGDDNTSISFKVKVSHYLDNYKLETFKINTDSGLKDENANIKINYQLFKHISTCDELISVSNHPKVNQNLLLNNDINCNDAQGNPRDVYIKSINRLVGHTGASVRELTVSELESNGSTVTLINNEFYIDNIDFSCTNVSEATISIGDSADTYNISSCKDSANAITFSVDYGYEIDNAEITLQSIFVGEKVNNKVIKNIKNNGNNFVDTLLSELAYITFENIDINKNTNYVGVIGRNMADIEQVVFDRVTVRGRSYLGMIGSDAANSVNNVIVSNSKVYYRVNSLSYIGGFAGYESVGDLTSITVKNTRVAPIPKNENSTSYESSLTTYAAYVGGMFGSLGYSTTSIQSNLNVEDSIIVGRTQVGGVVGRNNIKNATLSGSLVLTDCRNALDNYVGGIVGYTDTGGAVTYVNVDDSIIFAHNTNRVGGIAGQSHAVNEGYVRNTKIIDSENLEASYYKTLSGIDYKSVILDYTFDNASYNNPDKTSEYIGGIKGHGWSTMELNGVEDSKINMSFANRVGGLVGIQNGSYTLRYSFVTNTLVKGNKNVGGIAGYMTYAWIYHNFVNAQVEGNDYVGGMIGYLSNTGEEEINNRNYLYYNLAARTNVTSTGNKGAMFGYISADILSKNKNRIYANFLDVDGVGQDKTTTNYLIGGLSSSYFLSGLKDSTNLKNKVLYDRTIYDNDYFGYINLNSFKTDTTNNIFKNTLNFKNYSKWIYPAVSGYVTTYPYLPKQKNHILLPLSGQLTNIVPNTYTRVATSYNRKAIYEHIMPTINVYASDVDKLNIDFSKIDEESYFKIVYGDSETELQKIDKRTFSINYDYNTGFKIVLTDGGKVQEYEYSSLDFIHNIDVVNNDYYYIKDSKLYKNNEMLYTDIINVYKGKALSNNGNVYLLLNNEKYSIGDIFEILDKPIPLYAFTYDNYKINTYGTYSVSDGNIVNNNLVYVYNGKLYAISTTLNVKKDTLVLADFNNNIYQIILGNDGYLYNLKSSLFENINIQFNDIKYMTSNLDNNSNLIFIEYNNGERVCIDYINKKIIYSSEATKVPTLVDYLKTNLINSNEYDLSNINDEYSEADTLINNIKDVLVVNKDEVIDDSTLQVNDLLTNMNITKDSKYVKTYDPVKDEVVLYEEKDLLVNDSSISITEKIRINNTLSNTLLNTSNNSTIKDGLVILISIFVLILTSTFIYARYIRKSDKNLIKD